MTRIITIFPIRKLLQFLLACPLLLSCGTAYHADFSMPDNPDKMTNPYTQPVPSDGLAGAVRGHIHH